MAITVMAVTIFVLGVWIQFGLVCGFFLINSLNINYYL